MHFTDHVVVVTGAGSGIGKATVQRFAAEGAKIVAAEINQESLDALTKELTAEGRQIVGVQADVSRVEDCNRLIDTAKNKYGQLDVLVNNAAIMDRFLPVGEVTDEIWHRVMQVNLDSVMYTSRRALPIMLEQGKGVIVNIASSAGFGGGFAGAAYTTSKHGVIGLTKSIAVVYGSKGIRCIAISPGAVNTGIPLGGAPSEFGFSSLRAEMGTMPRVGEPGELADVILMVASDEASFLNGANIPVDGGWTAQG